VPNRSCRAKRAPRIEVSTAIGLDAPAANDRLFYHSILSQIGLPRSRVDGREFQRSFGAPWLNLQSDWLAEGMALYFNPSPMAPCPALRQTGFRR